MSPSDQALFDRPLLMTRRARAAKDAAAHDFLLRRVAGDMDARLDAVLREFPLALDLGAYHGVLGEMLRARANVGTVIEAEPSVALLGACPGLRVAASEEWLPFAGGSLDLVVSGLSLHLVNDLPGALAQIVRALKPDGLFMAAVLGGGTLSELRQAMTAAEAECEGGASPRVAPFADVRDFGALLQRAGFSLPVTDADSIEVTYETPLHLMRDLRAMAATNALAARARKPLRRATLMRASDIYCERFPAARGRVRATFEIVYLTGWAPHESQPKPLRPGSARARLADALGTVEIPAGDKADPRKGRG